MSDVEHVVESQEQVKGLGLLRARCAEVPDVLRQVAAQGVEAPAWLTPGARVVLTGAGLAEGAARLTAAALREVAGVDARFVPLTVFPGDAPPRADALIVCSQGLSPNAWLAMERGHAYRHRLLITSLTEGAGCCPERVARLRAWRVASGDVLCVPPDAEGKLLLRVLGPAASGFAGVLLAQAVALRAGLSGLDPEALAAVPERVAARVNTPAVSDELGARLLTEPLLMISCGLVDDAQHGLRWKLLEGLWRPAPECFDVLQFVHGPLQVFHPRAAVFLELTCTPGCVVEQALSARLTSMLDPGRHARMVLHAQGSGLLSVFEHDAQLNTLLCAALATTTRDLTSWPMHGQDGALYAVGSREALLTAPAPPPQSDP